MISILDTRAGSLPLSYLTILVLIKVRRRSRMTTAGIINRHIRSKCKKIYGIAISYTIFYKSKSIAKAARPARTYIQQLCEDTGWCTEDLPEAMNDREKWKERVRDIRATSTTWWWWWYDLSLFGKSHLLLNLRTRAQNQDGLTYW